MSPERDTRNTVVYSLSACAMLLGCWLLSKALQLQAGQLLGLLTLMFVLQLYEGLLVGLGAFLVRSGRAPHDGLVVLAIESIFLMDATLLSAECVSADLVAGTLVAFATAVLVVLKLVWVRWAAPELLSKTDGGHPGLARGRHPRAARRRRPSRRSPPADAARSLRLLVADGGTPRRGATPA